MPSVEQAWNKNTYFQLSMCLFVFPEPQVCPKSLAHPQALRADAVASQTAGKNASMPSYLPEFCIAKLASRHNKLRRPPCRSSKGKTGSMEEAHAKALSSQNLKCLRFSLLSASSALPDNLWLRSNLYFFLILIHNAYRRTSRGIPIIIVNGSM
jgi:hypothetical protein